MDGDIIVRRTKDEVVRRVEWYLDRAQQEARLLPTNRAVAKLRSQILLAALQATNV